MRFLRAQGKTRKKQGKFISLTWQRMLRIRVRPSPVYEKLKWGRKPVDEQTVLGIFRAIKFNLPGESPVS